MSNLSGGVNNFDEIAISSEGNVFPYKKEPFINVFKKVDLYKCENCSHIQMEYLLPENFYEEDDSSSKCRNAYFNLNPTKKFAERMYEYTNGGSLLEIGCGEGDFLKRASKYFNYLVGVEPSNKVDLQASSIKNNGAEIKIIRDYFTPKLKFEEKFDAVVSMAVFEHLEDPVGTLKYVHEILKDDGFYLINVPDGRRILREGLYSQIVLQHINYFTTESLMRMAKECGFEVVSIEQDSPIIEINMYLQKKLPYKPIKETMDRQKQTLKDWCKDLKNITVWGSGGKAPYYGQLLGNITVNHMVDGDKSKCGLYMQNIPVPVESPSKEIIDGSDAIIIFAPSYNGEIMKTLSEDYRYKGNIIYFERGELKIRYGTNGN